MTNIETWSVFESVFYTVSVIGGLLLGVFIASDPREARARRMERRRKRVAKAIERLYLAERKP